MKRLEAGRGNLDACLTFPLNHNQDRVTITHTRTWDFCTQAPLFATLWSTSLSSRVTKKNKKKKKLRAFPNLVDILHKRYGNAGENSSSVFAPTCFIAVFLKLNLALRLGLLSQLWLLYIMGAIKALHNWIKVQRSVKAVIHRLIQWCTQRRNVLYVSFGRKQTLIYLATQPNK